MYILNENTVKKHVLECIIEGIKIDLIVSDSKRVEIVICVI